MNLKKLVSRAFPEIRTRYTSRDTILYALGVGACRDPLDVRELRFAYEENLQALPSMCCVLAHPGFWLRAPELEVNWVKVMHGAQHFSLRSPLPPEGEVIGRYRVVGVRDKGAATGALIHFEKALHAGDGTLLGTVESAVFLRGDGGCGDWGEPGRELPESPAQAPTGAIEVPTARTAALLYRLNGDYNPLHADPQVAGKAGFDRPILHGLCTYGIACHSLIRALCDFDAARLRGMGARFKKPVFPGETIRTEYWAQADGTVRFRCLAMERNEVVLDRGTATITPAGSASR